MNEKEFQKLIKKDKYQVFLFSSQLPYPLNFIIHTWFVTSNKGKISRWEIWQSKNKCKTSWNHLHLNLFPTSEGMRKSYFTSKYIYNSTLINKIEGNKNSTAHKMLNLIEKESKNYPYNNKYFPFPGPNSNTFTQWIIDQFPKANFKLPKNALGKKYEIKK